MTLPFDRLRTVIDDGIRNNLQTCVQVFVSVDGGVLLNAGFGQANRHGPATAITMMPWRSAGKPLTAAAILRLAEAAHLSTDDPVGNHLPESRGTAIAKMPILDLLTHSTGVPLMQTPWPKAGWEETIAGILANIPAPIGEHVCYQPQATWFLLGEIVRRKASTPSFAEALMQLVLEPLGMTQSSCGLSDEYLDENAAELPDLRERTGPDMVPSSLCEGDALRTASPGGNMRGAVSDLGVFYEMLLEDGRSADGAEFLTSESVARMMTPHRVGRYDHTFQHRLDMGCGLITQSNGYGSGVPYGYGRHSSPRAVGHGGAQCAMGFCDPQWKLAVAWSANGLCGEFAHQRRNRLINEAIYEDLGLAAADGST